MTDPSTNHLINGVAGGLMGGLKVAIGFPIDTLKVRSQNNVLKGFYANLYRGFGLPITMAVVDYGVSFVIFSKAKDMIGKSTLFGTDTPHRELKVSMLSGFVSGALSAMIFCPVDAYKVCRQSRVPFALQNAYRGLSPMMARDSLQCSLYFGIYFHMRERYNATVSGGASGLITTLLAYPLDVIKSRAQAGITHFGANAAKTMVRGYGWALLRSCVTNMAGFTLYDRVLEWTAAYLE